MSPPYAMDFLAAGRWWRVADALADDRRDLENQTATFPAEIRIFEVDEEGNEVEQ